MKKRYSKEEKLFARKVIAWINDESDTLEITGDEIRRAWKLDFLISWYPSKLGEDVASRPIR